MQRLSDKDIAFLRAGCELEDVKVTHTGRMMKTALDELVELRALLACRDIGSTRIYQRPGVGTEHVMFLLHGAEHVVSREFARELAASIFHVLRSGS